MSKLSAIILVLLIGGLAVAQMPVAELPRVYVKTGWNPPTGGTTWAVHTSAQLSSAFSSSAPGDMIVLDAGVTYSGNFYLPAKVNPNGKWIYVTSSAVAKLPVGKRVSSTNASSMPKIVTSNVAAALQFNSGANHWRFAGIEVTSNSSYCVSGRNCMSYFLVGTQQPKTGWVIPDSIIFDRCYVHGQPTVDLQHGIIMMGSNYAVINSDIEEIHYQGSDSQALVAYYTPGPLKITNNLLVAAGENVFLGGAGGRYQPYVVSDVQIQNNYLYKPLSWVPLSLNGKMVVKNIFEIKGAQRVLFDSNILENEWVAGQNGQALDLTIRTSGGGGDNAVVNDITVTNNVLKNVVGFVDTIAADYYCGIAPYTDCGNPGSQARWYIANNLVTFWDATLAGGLGGGKTFMLEVNGGYNNVGQHTYIPLRDVVFQHNTGVAPAGQQCWASVYFSAANGQPHPPYSGISNNIWILDNVLCQQPTGDYQQQGMSGLTQYMGDPSASPNDLARRFYGNVMYVPPGSKLTAWQPHNYATTVPFTYVSANSGNYQLATPYWTDTSDGKLAGYSSTPAQVAATHQLSGSVAGPAGMFMALYNGSSSPTTTTTDGAGNYSFDGLPAGDYHVVPFSPQGLFFTPIFQTVTINGANVAAINFSTYRPF